jgi:hypothetical protein
MNASKYRGFGFLEEDAVEWPACIAVMMAGWMLKLGA